MDKKEKIDWELKFRDEQTDGQDLIKRLASAEEEIKKLTRLCRDMRWKLGLIRTISNKDDGEHAMSTLKIIKE